MTSIRIRPRFKKSTKELPENLTARFKEQVKKPDAVCVARILPNYMVFRIPEQKRHFWSPQLSVSIDKDEEDGNKTILRGLYGPNPTVWALIFYGYVILGIIGMFAAIAGLSELSLGNDPYMLWALPGLGGAAIILYFIAQFGQKMGVEETFMIHHFFEETLGEHVHIS